MINSIYPHVMSTPTQFERYQLLLEYIDKHFKEPLTPDIIQELCFYSYRNINRIFYALNQETIGQYIKRLRIEKSAEYLKYSEESVANIATAVGFSDTASFSKAFKKHIGTSPSVYRETVGIKSEMAQQIQNAKSSVVFEPIGYQLVELPERQVVYSQYRGSYDNVAEMLLLWERHIEFGLRNNLLRPETIYLAEILDDDAITGSLNCRYNACFSLDANLEFQSKQGFRKNLISGGTYAKFIHLGSHESSSDTYARIFSQWMQHVNLELADKAMLEIYASDSHSNSEEDRTTEIYIPVQI